jgi:hypothetical protein
LPVFFHAGEDDGVGGNRRLRIGDEKREEVLGRHYAIGSKQ